MKLMIREPLEEIEQLQKSIDRMFGDFVGRRPGWTFPTMEWAPPVELFETELEVVVKVALPNIDPKLLDIKVTDDTITIKGETKHGEEEKGRNYYQRELRYGKFLRTLELPAAVKAGEAKAVYKEGVLEVKVPKAEHAKATTVKVLPG